MIAEELTFLYFTDPMCSWCYGFSEAIAAVKATYPDFGLEVIAGGLRPYTTDPMPAGYAAEVQKHWHHVEEASGQTFDYTFFERNPGFIYDTEPSCRALNCAMRLRPGVGLQFLHRLQTRFYSNGELPTSIDTFVATAKDCKLDGDVFLGAFREPETLQLTRDGFARAHDLGVSGYPTLLLQINGRPRIITVGYQSFERIPAIVDGAIRRYGN